MFIGPLDCSGGILPDVNGLGMLVGILETGPAPVTVSEGACIVLPGVTGN